MKAIDVSPKAAVPPPTLANVHYGPNERQVLDFWKAPSSGPTPVIFYIHGGGWLGSDKTNIEIPGGIGRFLDEGISFVSTNYRYISQTILVDEAVPIPVITPAKVASEDAPVLRPLQDAARALQFVRSKAAEWNIDEARIGVSGSSAGACTSLWLTYHSDLADPASADPVLRESTRPWCAAVSNAQTTLDPKQMRDWTPNSRYGGHAFGFAWDPQDGMAEFRAFYAGRETVLPWIEEYSPYALAANGAPPVYLWHDQDAPAFGQEKKDPNHTANFGAILEEKLCRIGVEYEFVYPGAPDVKHPSPGDYLIDKLKAPGR